MRATCLLHAVRKLPVEKRLPAALAPMSRQPEDIMHQSVVPRTVGTIAFGAHDLQKNPFPRPSPKFRQETTFGNTAGRGDMDMEAEPPQFRCNLETGNSEAVSTFSRHGAQDPAVGEIACLQANPKTGTPRHLPCATRKRRKEQNTAMGTVPTRTSWNT